MSESRRRARLLEYSKSAARVLKDRGAVAESLGDPATRAKLEEVARPNSISGTLRKTGVALILAPDPVTGLAGVVMLGASFATKARTPLVPSSVYEETRKLLEEMDFL